MTNTSMSQRGHQEMRQTPSATADWGYRPTLTATQGRLLHINDGANAPWKK